MPLIEILVLGDMRRAEFRAAQRALDATGRVNAVSGAAAAEAALQRLEVRPELIVIAQSYPGEFTAAQVDRLRRHAPLARVVALLGSWCEGELRTGRPWPGAIRLYRHQVG